MKKPVFARAIAEVCWKYPNINFRNTLDKLISGNYNIPKEHLSILLEQMCIQKQTERSDLEEYPKREIARQQIATEFSLNKDLTKKDKLNILFLIGSKNEYTINKTEFGRKRNRIYAKSSWQHSK